MSLKSARLKAKKTVREVMEYIGVSDAAVYQWETGETTPRPDKLVKLSNFYGCTVDELLKKND